ncbi:MAG: type II toxin-antitoxin system PemK/MazF family toxin [Planctomycetota bacterium]
MRLDRGALILLDLNPMIGPEQRGFRPCVVVSDPAVTDDQRYPLVCVVPVTGTEGEGALYPLLRPNGSGLLRPSHALVDHLRSVDKRRVRRVFGRISGEELEALDDGLSLFLGLG